MDELLYRMVVVWMDEPLYRMGVVFLLITFGLAVLADMLYTMQKLHREKMERIQKP